MSREVDERIVELRMDNKDFETSANQSIDTLNRLEESLQLKGSNKGLAALQNAVNNFTMITVQNSIEAVGEKFNALESMAVGAFENIGRRAEETFNKYLKMFTTDNISAGWEKFGEKTTSVATLVSQLNPETGKNYSLDEVNEQLEKLNWFTDETSYNFTDMVSNISKFTATGKKLDDSVTAMQGIALWASRSGQGAQKASMAMYQLAQAMGKGALKYDDYKSIQNASMDTQEFRNAALDTAIALGKVEKAANGAYKVAGKEFADLNAMFSSEALSRTAWLDTDVMMKTFEKYGAAVEQIYKFSEENDVTASDAMDMMKKQGIEIDAFGLAAFKAGQEARTFADVIDSVKDAVSTGWMNSFEYIFGNYEEARDLWTAMANELYDIFAEPLNKQNIVLDIWKEGGGRASLLNGFKNLYEGFQNFIVPIKAAWGIIFPAKTHKEWAEALLKLTKGFEAISEKIKGFFDLADKGSEFFLEPILKSSKKLTIFEEQIQKFAGFIDDAGQPIGRFAKFIGEADDKIDEVQESLEATADSLEDLETMAKSVINGDWGNGEERIKRLREAGYNFELIQNKVNELLGCSYRYEVENDKLNSSLEKGTAITKANSKALEINAENLKAQGIELKKEDEITEEAMDHAGRLERIFLGMFAAVDIVKQTFQALGETLADVTGYFMEIIGLPLFDFLTRKMADLGDELLIFDLGLRNTDKLKKVFQPLGNGLKKVIDLTASFAKAVWPVLEKAFGAISAFLGKIKDNVKKAYEVINSNGTLDKIKASLTGIWESLKEIGGFVLERIGDSFGQLTAHIKNMNVDKDAVANVFNGIAKAIGFLGDKISTYKDAIIEFIDKFTSGKKALGGQGKSLFGGVDLGKKSVLENIGEILNNAWEMISKFIKELPDKIKSKFNETTGFLKDTFGDMFKDFNFNDFE